MSFPQQSAYLARIQETLEQANTLARSFSREDMVVTRKTNQDPVTEADHALNDLLQRALVRPDEGWLSEETVDDRQRLNHSLVWVVDPIDGTREFIAGLPEWVVSVGLVRDQQVIAGGILNPLGEQLFLGGLETEATLNGSPVRVTDPEGLAGVKVLASRSELRDGLWGPLEHSALEIIPQGSIAYKLALVAAGRVDATISLAPKNEWDVAAGVLLVQAAGGKVTDLSGNPIKFNQAQTLLNGVIAAGPHTFERLWDLLGQIR